MDSDTDATPDTDDPDPDRIDYDRLADRVLDRIEPASVVGDRVVLSRRQAIALGTGATSLAALGLFSGEASADVVGQVGTSADRVDVFAGAVDANSVSTDQADTRTGYDEVSASRSLNTQFTNNSGADMDLHIIITAVASPTDVAVDLLVDGDEVNRIQHTLELFDNFTFSATVQDGATYELTTQNPGDLRIFKWNEQT